MSAGTGNPGVDDNGYVGSAVDVARADELGSPLLAGGCVDDSAVLADGCVDGATPVGPGVRVNSAQPRATATPSRTRAASVTPIPAARGFSRNHVVTAPGCGRLNIRLAGRLQVHVVQNLKLGHHELLAAEELDCWLRPFEFG